jgi:hypothetical protein
MFLIRKKNSNHGALRMKISHLIIAAGLTITIASQASALMCMAPSLDESFDLARDAETTYGIFVGSVDVNEVEVKRLSKDGRSSFETVASFSGQSLFADGLTSPFERDITVRVDCMGDWCGTASDIENVVFFGKMKSSDDVELIASACGGDYYDASEENIALLFERLRSLK